MKMTTLLKSRGGFIIMGVVFAMMMFVLMAITGVAMLTNQSQVSINVLRMAQANALRFGAMEYVQKRLQYDVDWAALNGTTENIVLDGQTTAVTYTDVDLDPNRVDVASSTDAVVDMNHMARRNQRFTLYRLPQASHYSFFRGNNSNAATPVALTGTIRQHAYFNQSVTGGTFTDSLLYYSGNAPTSNITVGSSAVAVADPQPPTPSFDWGAAGNEYDARIAQYDTQIMAARDQAKGDISIDAPGTYDQAALEALETPNDNDGIVEANNFYINTVGAVIFQGPIKVVAYGDIRFHANVAGVCAAEGTDYKTSDGGCKKIGSTSVWSGVQADEGVTTGMDWTTANNVCNNLTNPNEGGSMVGDWRLPTTTQLQTAAADSAVDNPFSFNRAQRFWSSVTVAGGTHQAVDISLNTTANVPDAQKLAVVCVRNNVNSVLAGSVEFQPTGSGIEFAAGRSLVSSDDKRRIFNDPATVDPVYFYSRNYNSATNVQEGQMYITESVYLDPATAPRGVHNGYAMANNRLYVGPRSTFTKFLFYIPRTVPDPADLTWTARISNTLGLLTVAGSDRTTAGIASVSGAILSMSEASPNMRLQNTATTGLVYSNGTAANGRLLLQSVSHDGSMIANNLQGDQMSVVGDLTHTMFNVGGSVVFNTDHTLMPQSRMIDGFTGSVSVKEASWDGS